MKNSIYLVENSNLDLKEIRLLVEQGELKYETLDGIVSNMLNEIDLEAPKAIGNYKNNLRLRKRQLPHSWDEYLKTEYRNFESRYALMRSLSETDIKTELEKEILFQSVKSGDYHFLYKERYQRLISSYVETKTYFEKLNVLNRLKADDNIANDQFLSGQVTGTENEKSKEMRIKAKYYALLHYIRIEHGLANPITKDDNGRFPREEIESIAVNTYKLKKGQAFYKEYVNIQMSSISSIIKTLKKNYKEILIDISGNDVKIISILKKYPNNI